MMDRNAADRLDRQLMAELPSGGALPEVDEGRDNDNASRQRPAAGLRLAAGTMEVPEVEMRFWNDSCLRFFDTLQFIKPVGPR